MFGPKITGVFASRWKALWWAGSIMLLAYCTVPAADETGVVKVEKADTAHHSPWERDPE